MASTVSGGLGLRVRKRTTTSVVEPGGGTGPEAYTHESDEECLIVLEGRLDLRRSPTADPCA